MKTIKIKDVRKVVHKDKDSTFVEHSVVRQADDETTETGQNRPYPTLPKSANPDDPPAHASENE